MKRFIISIAAILAVAAADAQLISSSSIVVTREKLPDVKRGYQQSVDLSYNSQIDKKFGSSIDINYIGGFRFNNTFFLGLGTGLNLDVTDKSIPDIPYEDMHLPVNLVNIPVYAHFRAYFLKTRWTPFFALSVGGRFSASRDLDLELGKVQYSTIGVLLNPQIGVNYRTGAKGNIYLSVGFRGQTMPAVESVEASKVDLKNCFQYGVDAHIGFTF